MVISKQRRKYNLLVNMDVGATNIDVWGRDES